MKLNIFGKNNAKKAKKEPKAAKPAVQAVEETKESSVKMIPNSVLKHHFVSEKGTRLQAMDQYVFVVMPTATKPEIKKQVSRQYNVTVKSVRIINLPVKVRNVGRFTGAKAGARKAIVTLAKGDHIEQGI